MSIAVEQGTSSVAGNGAGAAVVRTNKPPKGHKWKMDSEGGLVIGADGQPIAVAKKTRQRKAGNEFGKPKNEAGEAVKFPIGTSVDSGLLKGFDIDTHSRLVEADFADNLDYANWAVWYAKQKLGKAEQYVESVLASGATAEIRAANKDQAKTVNTFETYGRKILAMPDGSAKDAAKARMRKMLTEMMGE